MAPIRVGFIGLSQPVDKPALLGVWAQMAHLPALLELKDLYQITALCNSSIQAAEASIKGHGLPASTKAYDDPAHIANDPNVDLIVVSVFIGKHYQLVKPALEAGKMVYVEARLAASVQEAEELAALARAKGVRTMVATQGRGSAVIARARKLIADSEIGEVVSSSVMAAFAGFSGMKRLPFSAKWALDLESVGNTLLISFAHFFDVHRQVLGDFKSYNALIESKSSARDLVDASGNVIESSVPTTPDHIFIQGKLPSGALASIAWRANKKPSDPFAPDLEDMSYFRWVITGSEGEVEMTNPDIQYQMAASTGKLYLTKNNAKQEVVVPKEHGDLSFLAENHAAQYAAFAKGDSSRYADFEEAAKFARIMEGLREIARAQLNA